MDGAARDDIKGNSGAGERLKRLRLEMDASQREFGDPIGFNQAAVSAFEQGKVVLRKPDALAVEHVYGVRHEWLLHGEGSRERAEPRNLSALADDQKEVLRIHRQMSFQDREVWAKIGRLMAREAWDGRAERRGEDRRKADRRSDSQGVRVSDGRARPDASTPPGQPRQSATDTAPPQRSTDRRERRN